MPTWSETTWTALSDGDDRGQQQGGEVRREHLIRVSHPAQEISAEQIVNKLQAGDDKDECPWRAKVGLPFNYWYDVGHPGGHQWKQVDPPMADYQPTDDDDEVCLNGPMLVRSINCDAYSGSTRCHDIRIVTTGFGPSSNDTTGNASAAQIDPPLVTISVSSKGVTSPGWRADPCAADDPVSPCPDPPETAPTSGADFAAWGAADILGTPVDYNTQPQPVSRDQTAIEISVLRRGPYQDWVDYSSASDGSVEYVSPYTGFNLATLHNSLHHRNDAAFAGFEYGTLLLTDTKMQRVHHEYVRLVYSMLYDEWRHARQRPKAVITNSNEGPKTMTDGIGHLSEVFWFQQFLGSVDMETGFNTAELAIIDEWGK